MESDVGLLLLITVLLGIVLPVVLVVVFAVIGQAREQRHLAELDAREAAVRHVVVTDLRSAGADARTGVLVAGNAVMAADYGKQVVAQLRMLVGGEVRSYQGLLSRARREARLRMIEQALSHGSTEIHNVRFTTSTIRGRSTNGGMAITEIICWGTAVSR